ncbi:MAG TPA: tRNA uridine-5-carboxymethylaminomethyl(34) synthesis enzyme MnmG [Candidatus Fimihabitans intestinipullorum]|uniref:tRNA uridine 5-carboxymethylaminomethyl modification enzyme MnmG n=1 Tax=Candidatus Fimihabitans intestinipullorum TaxID=2840820 RepID=A0A9D1L356_9BACT|nr:tRNA uridine-5-carboxymethylaminomethyl(34) synthesis enzyme MnmG [Candidatus Fimihabitans intestinipullorum]
MDYEVIVVGGGHAGCEAALACARKGHKTLLATGNIQNIADMPCNPSIGGSAKGIVVREIDALGGEMGINADKSLIQMKMLNSKKGPAVRALRAQADKITYPEEMRKTLFHQENLTVLECMVEDLIVEDHCAKGVILDDETKITSERVILTTGTYLKADILVGDTRRREGPHGEKPSNHLSDRLKDLGFKIIRLKTGTPQRILKSSIDFSVTQEEKGDSVYHTFSHDCEPFYDIDDQISCYLVYTSEKTHQIIRDHLNESSMYGGLDDIEGIGPRYCPSIEDKIVRFADKERHQLFLEPESRYLDEIYIQGFSTSMPYNVQEEMVHSLKGLEHAVIKKYAYAIEYDAIYPTQLKPTLETKIIQNLYTAGQINGTSGYEEAACQGLMAGINASLSLEHKEPLVLKRSDAYIGVLIDDLVTKGVRDPYRLLTSRAEYRLLLRSDNADLRLREYGYQVGLINEEKYKNYCQKKQEIEALTNYLKEHKVTPTREVNDYLKSIPSTELKDGISLYNLLKRPEITMQHLQHFIEIPYTDEIQEQVLIHNKYEGYILKAQKEAEKMLRLEAKKIPETIDYDKIVNIASEARQKLKEVRPTSIGQAIRISGVNPSDISILMVYLKKGGNQ